MHRPEIEPGLPVRQAGDQNVRDDLDMSLFVLWSLKGKTHGGVVTHLLSKISSQSIRTQMVKKYTRPIDKIWMQASRDYISLVWFDTRSRSLDLDSDLFPPYIIEKAVELSERK